jgi:hypothetical protein
VVIKAVPAIKFINIPIKPPSPALKINKKLFIIRVKNPGKKPYPIVIKMIKLSLGSNFKKGNKGIIGNSIKVKRKESAPNIPTIATLLPRMQTSIL